MNTIRVLQRLVGDVDRVNELLDLLDKVKRDKRDEATAHVQVRFSRMHAGSPPRSVCKLHAPNAYLRAVLTQGHVHEWS